jgi:hypothetical protein
MVAMAASGLSLLSLTARSILKCFISLNPVVEITLFLRWLDCAPVHLTPAPMQFVHQRYTLAMRHPKRGA